MTKSYTNTPPQWQSQTLLVGALLALGAAELGAVAYAYQSASRSQILELGGFGVPTDVVLKTAMSVAAGLCVALGPAVAAHLWRSGRKGQRRQALLAIAAALVGLCVSTSNLSGYFAWTRGQREIETVTSNPLYAVAVANAERVARGEISYLTGADRRLLSEGQALSAAARDGGDVGRALFVLILISAMGSAYRLPAKPKAAKRTRRRRNDTSEIDGARAKRVR